MAMTPEQIAQATGYFTSNMNQGNNLVKSAMNQTAFAAPKAAPAVKLASSVQPAGGNVGGGTSSKTPPHGILDWLFNPLSAALNTPFAHDNSTGSKSSSIAQDAAVPQGTDQAPKNLTQWLLNALSTGDYASGRFLKQVAVTGAQDKAFQAAHPGPNAVTADPKATNSQGVFGPGGIFRGAGEIGQELAGAARGVAEGFGARFNNQAPVTPGSDLNAAGGMQAIKNAVTGAGGSPGLANFTAGAAGFGADVVGDPTNLIGLGEAGALVKGAKAGAGASLDVLRQGGRLDDAITAGVHTAADTQRAVKADAQAVKLTAADRAAPVVDLKTGLATDAANRAAALDIPTSVPALAEDLKLTPKAAEVIPKPVEIPPAIVPELAAKAVVSPEMKAIQDLLPTLADKGRTVDPAAILQGARVATASAKLDPAIAATATHVLHDAATVPEITAGLKTLKSTADGKTFLATPLTTGKTQTTAGAALEHAAMNRVTRGTGQPSASAIAAQTAVETHIAQQTLPKFTTNPASMAASISANVPDLKTGVGPLDVPALMGKLAPMRSQAARQALVAKTLNVPTAGFKTFDEAINSATRGQVEASAMRSMLKALGINSRASKPDTLRTILSGRGRMRWDEIQKGVPTAQEVLDNHGIPAEVADASKTVDVPAERAGAAAEAQAQVEGLTSTQQGLYQIGLKAGHAEPGLVTKPTYVESYTTKLYNTIQQPVIAAASRIANNVAGPDGKALTGQLRADFMYEHVVPVLTALDKTMLGEGRVARLVSGAQTPFHVPLSQIIPELPPNLVKSALFNLDFRLTAEGAGYTGKVASPEFTKGFTIYPTTIGYGAKAARDGKNPLEIFNAMNAYSHSNKFESSDAGQAIMRELAAEMSKAPFVRAMTAADITNQTLAVANAQKAATDFVNPIASDIMAAVASGGDRSTAINLSHEAARRISQMAPSEDDSLVQDMAGQRIHNGVVYALGEEGMALARSDARTSTGSAAEQLAKQAVSNGSPLKSIKNGSWAAGTTKAPALAKVNQKIAEDLGALRNDLDTRIEGDAQSLIDQGAYPATAQGNYEAHLDAEIGLGWGKGFAKLADWVNDKMNGLAGEGGYEGSGGLRLQYTDGSRRMAADYSKRQGVWQKGGSWNGQKFAPLATRIQQALNLPQPPAKEDLTGYIKNWFTALQVHGAQALRDGVQLTDNTLSDKLLAGEPFNAAAAVHTAAPALTPGEVPMVLELQHMIDEVWSPVNGAMSRIPANAADVMKELHAWGTGNDFTLDETKTLAEQASSWHNWDVSTMDTPLRVLNQSNRALMASSVKPSIAATASRVFGSATREAGMVRIDPASTKGLLKYLDGNLWFPKDIVNQFAHTEAKINALTGLPPQQLAEALIWYDRGMNVMKQSMTSYNPSHWVTNMLGDSGFNMISGVDPRNVFRALKVMHATRQLDINPEPLLQAAHDSGFADAAGAAASWKKFGSDYVYVNVNGKNVAHSIDQIKELGMQRGVDLTGHQSNDMIDIGTQGNSGDWFDRLGRSKLNPLSYANKVIDPGSAARDNLNRWPQFIDALESRKFKNLDEAYSYAANEVHKTHPTGSALSKFERSGIRRIVTFYSWQRLALGRVLELALEHPGLITMPSKFQYEQAQAAGFDPESIGKPFGSDPRIASYEYNGIYGPTFTSGYSPFGGTADLAGGTPHDWGFSVSSPAMDALSSAFQGATMDTQAKMNQNVAQELGSNISPIIAMPAEWIFNSNPGGIGKAPQSDPGAFLLNNSGAPGRIVKAFGLAPKKTATGQLANTPQQQAGDNSRQMVNYLSGLKFTDYTNDTSKAYAAKEQGQQNGAALKAAGYTPAQVKAMIAAQKP